MVRADDDRASNGGVRAASRALAILRVLGERHHDEAWTLDEIARTLDLPKSTTHRLLMTLKSQGFAEAGAGTATYRLGVEAAIVGSRAIHNQRPRSEVRQLIAAAASEIGETVGLGVLKGRRVLVVEKGVPPRPFSWNLGIGSTLPAHASAAGKVLLSALGDSAVEAMYEGEVILERSGPNTITDLGVLLAELELTRRRGYALDLEEFEEGLRCVAVPIWAEPARVTHSLGITGPVSRVTEQRLHELANLLTSSLTTDVTRYLSLEHAVEGL
jgi:DNA-binding IclR family transcriptional regulator